MKQNTKPTLPEDFTIPTELIAKIYQDQLSAITEEPYTLRINEDYTVVDNSMVPGKKMLKRLSKVKLFVKILPFFKHYCTVKSITIKPPKAATMLAILPHIVTIGPDVNFLIPKKGKKPYDVNKPFSFKAAELMTKYTDNVINVISLAVFGLPGLVPVWYKSFLLANFDHEELFILVNAVFARTNHSSFYKSIIHLKGMSPTDDKGIIACQNNLKANLTKGATSISTKPSSTAKKD